MTDEQFRLWGGLDGSKVEGRKNIAAGKRQFRLVPAPQPAPTLLAQRLVAEMPRSPVRCL